MKIDIASPHEQMSNSTVTISATFFECIHEIMKTYTHFTIAWPPKGLKYPLKPVILTKIPIFYFTV